MRASRWLTYGGYMCSPAGAAAVSGPSGASCAPVIAGPAATERACMVGSAVCELLSDPRYGISNTEAYPGWTAGLALDV